MLLHRRPRSSALALPATLVALAALAAGVAEGFASHPSRHAVPARRPVARIHDPGYVVSSEALAGHPSAPPPPAPRACQPRPQERPIASPRWLDQVAITEYFPTPESWFHGRRVRAPGLSGLHHADWLYSSSGIAMEGEGIGLDGRKYAIDQTGSGGWVNAAGHLTVPGTCASHWSHGAPSWFAGGWRNSAGAVTFPLERGGWSNGAGTHTASYQGATFVRRESPSIRPYRTLAVDPGLIPLGSRIYIPAYRPINGGWFVAGDTGGGIIGRHVDVYRPPTAIRDDGGRYLPNERIYVIPPGS